MDPTPTTAPWPDGAVVEPVPEPLARLLREAVRQHASREPRRVHPPAVHVGVPGQVQAHLVLDGDTVTDLALRTDALEAMVRRVRRPGPPPLVWLTRRGDLAEVYDVDLDWWVATRAAAAELGVALPMVVVTRKGWRDPRTGVGRTWVRVRRTGGSAG